MVTTRSMIDYDALVKEDRVHGDVYLRQDIFDDEMAKIFHQGWVYVGHAGEIPQAGDYRLSQIGQQSVIMTRDEDGAIHLLMNRCTHRANAVCQSCIWRRTGSGPGAISGRTWTAAAVKNENRRWLSG